MTEQSSNHNLNGEHSARLLYTLYMALAGEFSIDLQPCHELETGSDLSPQSLAEAHAWFQAADDRIAVHQLRQFLQTSTLARQESLQAALEHYLSKPEHGDSDRDKIDFLLVQFLSVSASSPEPEDEASVAFVAGVLEPVLGKAESSLPESLEPLEDLIKAANACQSLNEVFNSGILEKGRTLKAACGNEYFSVAAMVAFTRFNFLMRRVFFRLMHRDLNAILDGLRQLEVRGIGHLDCRSAEFSAEEPVSRLRMICQSWKVMFQAEYSFGQPLRLLVDLRVAIDATLANDNPSKNDTEIENNAFETATLENTHTEGANQESSNQESSSLESASPESNLESNNSETANQENEAQPEHEEADAAEPFLLARAAAASGDASQAVTSEEADVELLDIDGEDAE